MPIINSQNRYYKMQISFANSEGKKYLSGKWLLHLHISKTAMSFTNNRGSKNMEDNPSIFLQASHASQQFLDVIQ